MRSIKKTSFVLIFIAIEILVLSSFRGVTLAAPAQDNSHGTFYDIFSDATGITTTGSAEFDTYQNNIRIADNNNASLHLGSLFIFKIFNPSVLIKPLGKIFDVDTQKSIGRSLVYLFKPQLNELTQTQVADTQGRCGFLIGDEKYYLVAQKPGYVFPQDKMEIVGQAGSMVKKDLGMRKI